MGQRYVANEPFEYKNGAIGYRPGGPFDVIGPYAKVVNCPIREAPEVRLTCYATGVALKNAWIIPACTRFRGRHIGGYFTTDEGNIYFNVFDSYQKKFLELYKTYNANKNKSKKGTK